MAARKKSKETRIHERDDTRNDVVRNLAEAEGGSFSLEDAALLLSISADQLGAHVRARRVIAWSDHEGKIHLPKWQFDDRGLLTGIRQVLEILRSQDEWRVMRYFLGKRHSLDNQRPLDLLRAREVGKVVAHARNHLEENTW